ncbi:hypothetical protein [Lutibaculum baratangense]|uniref:Uncharacterized protein n=1 Tax=Lutibaculum baratangense AMV1 TaxID=631454 RepID=V4QVB6_9HYPH|nr:hypothetical protein [Lutibaculum baratangense]ESR23712.1 hypothetical protein N177_2942 [Lutibaculum baratangense AMV1]
MSDESKAKASREERLAEALRANLRRRKSQARARAARETEAEADDEPPAREE